MQNTEISKAYNMKMVLCKYSDIILLCVLDTDLIGPNYAKGSRLIISLFDCKNGELVYEDYIKKKKGFVSAFLCVSFASSNIYVVALTTRDVTVYKYQYGEKQKQLFCGPFSYTVRPFCGAIDSSENLLLSDLRFVYKAENYGKEKLLGTNIEFDCITIMEFNSQQNLFIKDNNTVFVFDKDYKLLFEKKIPGDYLMNFCIDLWDDSFFACTTKTISRHRPDGEHVCTKDIGTITNDLSHTCSYRGRVFFLANNYCQKINKVLFK